MTVHVVEFDGSGTSEGDLSTFATTLAELRLRELEVERVTRGASLPPCRAGVPNPGRTFTLDGSVETFGGETVLRPIGQGKPDLFVNSLPELRRLL